MPVEFLNDLDFRICIFKPIDYSTNSRISLQIATSNLELFRLRPSIMATLI